ncbi:MAG: fumarate reductase subunit FrdD [Terriglobia bacterium]
MRKGITPLLWSLFGAGGVVAALLFPIHLLLTGLAFPGGWLDAPSYDVGLTLLKQPLTRLYFFVLISLPLFHAAHRLRYTVNDTLRVKPLRAPIALLCYGAALVGTAAAAFTLATLG